MSSSFTRARSKLSSHEIALIEDVLRRWYRKPPGRVVSVNLRDREHYLSTPSTVALVRTLIAEKNVDFTSLASRYQDECYQHQLQGGALRLPLLPQRLGRAVDTRDFMSMLTRTHSSYFPDMVSAAHFVDGLVTGQPLKPKELSLLLSPYTAWVTWDEEDSSADPFSFIVHGLALEVRAALGLDRRVSGPLLLFRYNRPANLTLHRATIADAGLNPYFDPPPFAIKSHSYTRPWPPEAILKADPGAHALAELHAAPRPEAVHGPLEIRHLGKPVRELR